MQATYDDMVGYDKSYDMIDHFKLINWIKTLNEKELSYLTEYYVIQGMKEIGKLKDWYFEAARYCRMRYCYLAGIEIDHED